MQAIGRGGMRHATAVARWSPPSRQSLVWLLRGVVGAASAAQDRRTPKFRAGAGSAVSLHSSSARPYRTVRRMRAFFFWLPLSVPACAPMH
jgi:hypothetical protein